MNKENLIKNLEITTGCLMCKHCKIMRSRKTYLVCDKYHIFRWPYEWCIHYVRNEEESLEELVDKYLDE